MVRDIGLSTESHDVSQWIMICFWTWYLRQPHSSSWLLTLKRFCLAFWLLS
jgi:hypothetical protein